MTPAIVPPKPSLPSLDPADVPDLDQFVTQDDTPVDNLYVEKQQRLLTEPLYSSWSGPGGGRSFLVLANVGLFYSSIEPPLVPDAMLSLDVPAELHPRQKEHRSYFTWIMGKYPDVTIEIVSDLRGGEEGEKMRAYARMNIPYYVIYDPENELGHGVLRAFSLTRKRYKKMSPELFGEIGLGLKLWRGEYEGQRYEWLRWCDPNGKLIATGKELADAQRRRADTQRRRAEAAEARIQRLEAQLRELGAKPRNGG